jgi:hypothetical protein
MQEGISIQETTYLRRNFLLGELAKLREASFPFSCLSDRPSAWNNSGSAGRIFFKFDTFCKSVHNINFSLSPINTSDHILLTSS